MTIKEKFEYIENTKFGNPYNLVVSPRRKGNEEFVVAVLGENKNRILNILKSSYNLDGDFSEEPYGIIAINLIYKLLKEYENRTNI